MTDFKSPGLNDFSGQGGYSGSGQHDCPAGQHWDDKQLKCVDDTVVGNKPDGHAYIIQSSPNDSGLVWNTVFEDNNNTDANKDYDNAVAAGGYWQMLVDGFMTKTNLSISDRYDAVEKQKAKDYLRDQWSVAINGVWNKDYSTLEAAKESFAADNYTGNTYVITDKNNAVVYTYTAPTEAGDPNRATESGVMPGGGTFGGSEPGDGPSTGELPNLDALAAVVLVILVFGAVGYALTVG